MTDPKLLRRNTDPSTSHAAASSMESLTARHKRIVMETLAAHPCGLTPHEVADRCSLDHSQCWRRMSDLERDGFIEPCGKRPQPSGRMARVMWIKSEQLDALRRELLYDAATSNKATTNGKDAKTMDT